jgi:hypothetical protein
MPDTFQTLDDITKPDPRCDHITIEKFHALLAELQLHAGVPEEVRTHFDTTRNLFLYSWFVYRFGRVAEWHACASLELALKIKTGGQIKGLHKLIEHVIAKGWVKNEGFSVRRRAKASHEQEKLLWKGLLRATGRQDDRLENAQFDYDYLDVLTDIPDIRNEYAHGSHVLYPGPYLHLKVISEFINQLFDAPS